MTSWNTIRCKCGAYKDFPISPTSFFRGFEFFVSQKDKNFIVNLIFFAFSKKKIIYNTTLLFSTFCKSIMKFNWLSYYWHCLFWGLSNQQNTNWKWRVFFKFSIYVKKSVFLSFKKVNRKLFKFGWQKNNEFLWVVSMSLKWYFRNRIFVNFIVLIGI